MPQILIDGFSLHIRSSREMVCMCGVKYSDYRVTSVHLTL